MALNHLFSPPFFDELFQHYIISRQGRILASDQELQKYRSFLTERTKDRTFQIFTDRKCLVNRVQTLLKTSNVPAKSNKQMKIALKKLGFHFTEEGTVTCEKFPEPRKQNLGPPFLRRSQHERQIAANKASRKVQNRDLKQLGDWLTRIADPKTRVQRAPERTADEWREEERKYRAKMESVLKEMAKGRKVLVRKYENEIQYKWISAMERILNTIARSRKLFETPLSRDSLTRAVDGPQSQVDGRPAAEVMKVPKKECVEDTSAEIDPNTESGKRDSQTTEDVLKDDKFKTSDIRMARPTTPPKESDSRVQAANDLVLNEKEDVIFEDTHKSDATISERSPSSPVESENGTAHNIIPENDLSQTKDVPKEEEIGVSDNECPEDKITEFNRETGYKRGNSIKAEHIVQDDEHEASDIATVESKELQKRSDSQVHAAEALAGGKEEDVLIDIEKETAYYRKGSPSDPDQGLASAEEPASEQDKEIRDSKMEKISPNRYPPEISSDLTMVLDSQSGWSPNREDSATESSSKENDSEQNRVKSISVPRYSKSSEDGNTPTAEETLTENDELLQGSENSASRESTAERSTVTTRLRKSSESDSFDK